jgi:hypothetical protein
MIQIAVINATTVLKDAEVKAMMDAVQTQVHRDFLPAWGIDATLNFVAKDKTLPPNMSWMAVLDDADQAGALGYHDVTNEGLPLGKVFAKTTLADHGKVSVTLSHEVLEMLADPDVNLLCEVRDGHARRYFAYEVCDAVEADNLGYDINGVTVSDFVTPAYFETFLPKGRTFDFKNHLSGPIPTLAPGGYLAYEQGGSWHQVFADSMTTHQRFLARPHSGSRRQRRMLGKEQWLKSTVAGG